MKVIIAGSRSYTNIEHLIEEAVANSDLEISELVCGMARGIDLEARSLALDYDIPVKEFPANWDRFGRAAGAYRNAEMADYCDAAIIIWNLESPGSANMIRNMKRVKKPYFVYTIVNSEIEYVNI